MIVKLLLRPFLFLKSIVLDRDSFSLSTWQNNRWYANPPEGLSPERIQTHHYKSPNP